MTQTFLHSCSIYRTLLTRLFNMPTSKLTTYNGQRTCQPFQTLLRYFPGRFAPPLSQKIISYFLFSKTGYTSSTFPFSADHCISYSFEKIKAKQLVLPHSPISKHEPNCSVYTLSHPFCHICVLSPWLALVFPWNGNFFPLHHCSSSV